MMKQKVKARHPSKHKLTLNRTDSQNLEPVLVVRPTMPSQIRITPPLKPPRQESKPALLPSLNSSKLTPLPHSEPQPHCLLLRKPTQSHSRSTHFSRRPSFDLGHPNPRKSCQVSQTGELIRLLQRKRMIVPHFTHFQVGGDKLELILLFVQEQVRRRQIVADELQLDRFMDKSERGEIEEKGFTSVLCSNTLSIAIQELHEMRIESLQLLQQIRQRQAQKQALTEAIQLKTKELTALQSESAQLRSRIDSQQLTLTQITKEIKSSALLLTTLQTQRQAICDFVRQQPNLIVRQAAQYHKGLELDLFEFADVLKYHPHGRKDYEPSIYAHEIERLMAIELKDFNRFLIQDASTSVETKTRCLRDFLAKIDKQYNLLIQELREAITTKTAFIRKYTGFIDRWFQNYLTKKEFLSNLSLSFAYHVEIYMGRLAVGEAGGQQAQQAVESIIEIFKMGNNFY